MWLNIDRITLLTEWKTTYFLPNTMYETILLFMLNHRCCDKPRAFASWLLLFPFIDSWRNWSQGLKGHKEWRKEKKQLNPLCKNQSDALRKGVRVHINTHWQKVNYFSFPVLFRAGLFSVVQYRRSWLTKRLNFLVLFFSTLLSGREGQEERQNIKAIDPNQLPVWPSLAQSLKQ